MVGFLQERFEIVAVVCVRFKLNVNKETAYKEILRYANGAVVGVCRCLDQVKRMWFNKIKDLQVTCVLNGGGATTVTLPG